MLQLAHDYDWESDIENVSGKPLHDLMGIRSNLIILLSPVCRSLKALAEFMCVDVNDDCLRDLDACGARFRDCFTAVNDAFSGKDIHFCWIDIHSHEEKVESDESEQQFALIGNEIRKLGWGFCSKDLIVLGSALVSFGLIYPYVVSSKLLDSQRLDNRIRGQLNLEISDVHGKPLECKCCDLDLLHLKVSSKSRSGDIIRTREVGSSKGQAVNSVNTFLGNLNDGVMKLHVTAVRRYTKCDNFEGFSSDQFLVRSTESGKKEKDGSDNLFADRVLELLAGENSKLFQKHMVPTWQIFLGFLYREGYWAMLSLSNSNGDSYMGILKPFTVHSAVLSLLDNNQFLVQDAGGAKLPMIQNVFSQGDGDSQKGTSPLGKSVHVGDGKRKKIKKHTFRDLTWSSFCKAAYESLDLDLAEVYFANGFKKSKKLKFLKCWMKEVKNKGVFYNNIPDGLSQTAPDLNKQKETDINEKLTASYQESDEPLSTHICSNQSRMQDDATFLSSSETSESFFSNLPTKIHQGLESDGVDLKILAGKLVDSSIYWLRQKHDRTENHDESCTIRVSEIIKVLLREPKDLKQHKDSNPSLQSPNHCSTSEYLVREYELQILLRMEILQSELAGSIQGSMKVKLVKQICSLLEIIQYLVEGGFHGDMSLYDYVERTIKSRYSHKLGDVVDKIYDQMDLLPFGEEDEAQALMLNSEDSNQSWREKPDMGASKTIQDSFSAEDDSAHPHENINKSEEQHTKEDHVQKLNEARERRERARRFVSFTSRMPDLQRVWAPKQSKIKPPAFVKESKRKKQRRVSYSVVCETPLTVKDEGSKGCSSVSKALFQDDDDDDR